MSNSKISGKSRLTGCFGKCALPGQKTRPKKIPSKQRSIQRLSFSDVSNSGVLSPEDLSISLVGSNLFVFTIMELQTITQGFSMSNFLGEGGFGPVYKGFVDEKVKPGLKAQPVAVKLLDLDGAQGHKEWLAEVIYLGQLRHQHLVKLIGYCYEDEHRLLVYEFMARGSLERHLFRKYLATLPWLTRLKIAIGAAKGLAFLHEAEQRIIFRDFKTSNILLDSDFEAKLSDFGLAKDGPDGDETHISTRVMGTHGYAAPEYIMTGHLTAKSDVYSFGVVLLELLTGRRSVDKTRPTREQNLVEWARPSLNNPQKLARFMDPSLDGQYSTKGAQKAASLAHQCLSQNPKSRPHMSVVVDTLEPLLAFDDIPPSSFVYTVELEEDKEKGKEKENEKEKDNVEGKANENVNDNENEKGNMNQSENYKEKKNVNENEKGGSQNGNESKNENKNREGIERKKENEMENGNENENESKTGEENEIKSGNENEGENESENEERNENENARGKKLNRSGQRHKVKNGFGSKEVGKWICRSYQKSEKTERDV